MFEVLFVVLILKKVLIIFLAAGKGISETEKIVGIVIMIGGVAFFSYIMM